MNNKIKIVSIIILVLAIVSVLAYQAVSIHKLNKTVEFLQGNFDALDERTSDLESHFEEIEEYFNHKF